MEAPSIIPPISKVEILQTTSITAAVQGTTTPSEDNGFPMITERELALLDGLAPFKSVHRQLIPKRSDKDPIMEEHLFYCRDTRHGQNQDQDQNQEKDANKSTLAAPRVPNQAIFAPIIARTTSTTNSKVAEADSEQEGDKDTIKILTEMLPFYYPKVRGFRYGYQFDPEDAPEDKDDDHFQDDGETEKNDDEDTQGQGDGEKQSTIMPVPVAKKKNAPKNRFISRRTGWLSLDLYLKGDEGEFTDKIVSLSGSC